MIKVMNKNLCESCFEETASEKCSACGFSRKSYEPDPTVLQCGTKLQDRYIIGKVIGRGGFGITYLAYDIKLERKVAVKEFYPTGLALRNPNSEIVSVTDDEAADTFRNGAEKFYNEARLIAKFNGNPNIVGVYDFFYQNDTVYYVMEYLRGQTLKDYAKAHGNVSAEEAVYIAEEIANALMAAHSTNVLHRDISPDNILLCSDGRVKLIDFGAARQILAESSQSLSVILKQGFAPLEQYQRKGKQGPWTDIYSLGATLYYILTGDIIDDPMSRLEDDEEFASNKYNIAPELWDIIRKATMLKKDERYVDIFQFRNALNGISIEPVPITKVIIEEPHEVKNIPVSNTAKPYHKSSAENKAVGETVAAREADVSGMITMPARGGNDGMVTMPLDEKNMSAESVKKKKRINPFMIAVPALLAVAVICIAVFAGGSSDDIASEESLTTSLTSESETTTVKTTKKTTTSSKKTSSDDNGASPFESPETTTQRKGAGTENDVKGGDKPFETPVTEEKVTEVPSAPNKEPDPPSGQDKPEEKPQTSAPPKENQKQPEKTTTTAKITTTTTAKTTVKTTAKTTAKTTQKKTEPKITYKEATNKKINASARVPSDYKEVPAEDNMTLQYESPNESGLLVYYAEVVDYYPIVSYKDFADISDMFLKSILKSGSTYKIQSRGYTKYAGRNAYEFKIAQTCGNKKYNATIECVDAQTEHGAYVVFAGSLDGDEKENKIASEFLSTVTFSGKPSSGLPGYKLYCSDSFGICFFYDTGLTKAPQEDIRTSPYINLKFNDSSYSSIEVYPNFPKTLKEVQEGFKTYSNVNSVSDIAEIEAGGQTYRYVYATFKDKYGKIERDSFHLMTTIDGVNITVIIITYSDLGESCSNKMNEQASLIMASMRLYSGK